MPRPPSWRFWKAFDDDLVRQGSREADPASPTTSYHGHNARLSRPTQPNLGVAAQTHSRKDRGVLVADGRTADHAGFSGLELIEGTADGGHAAIVRS
jgi:hypothetical protein